MTSCIKKITLSDVPADSTVPTYYGHSKGTTPVNVEITYGPPTAGGPYIEERTTSENVSYGTIDYRNREQRRGNKKKETNPPFYKGLYRKERTWNKT
jgi:hypothetical protein